MEEEDNGGETNVFTKFGQMWNDYQELKNAGNYLLLGSVINGATRVGEVSNDAQKINNAGIFDTLGIPYSNKDLEEAVSDISRTREYDNNNENNKYIKAVFEKQKYTKLVAEKSDTLRQQHPEWNEKEIDWNAKYQVLIEKCGNLLGEEREQFVRDHLPEFKVYYDSGNNVINDLNYQGVNDVKLLIGEIYIDPLNPATVDSQPEENYTIHPDSFGINRRYNNQGIMHSDDLVSYFALDSAIRGAFPTDQIRDGLDTVNSFSDALLTVPFPVTEGIGGVGKIGAKLGIGVLGIFRTEKAVDVVDGLSKAGKLVGSLDGLTSAERTVVNDLLTQGKKVEIIPTSTVTSAKTPDFLVEGIKTELKTLQNPNTNTGMKRIQEAFKQGAETVIIDARESGMGSSQAQEIINRAAGKYTNGQFPGRVEIWTKEGIIIN